jgi:hypothetical protein
MFDNATPFVANDMLTAVMFTPQAVPEPSALLPLGLGVVGVMIRRRKKS